MRNLIKKTIGFFVCALSLSACCLSQVTYEEFHNKAMAVEEHDFTKAVVNGEMKMDLLGLNVSVEFDDVTLDFEDGVWEAPEGSSTDSPAIKALDIIANTAATVTDDATLTTKIKYYVGNGFKVEGTYIDEDDENANIDYTIEFNQYGLLTKVKGTLGSSTEVLGSTVTVNADFDINVRYSK